MVQRDDVPLVGEDRGARRPRRGVGLVVDEVVEEVDDLVLAQRELLGLAVGVLDDVDELAEDDLALPRDEGQPAEARQLGAVPAALLDRDHGEVQVVVGQEQAVRVELEGHRRQRQAVRAGLVVELDVRAPGFLGIGEDVVVRQQHARSDEEAGGELARTAHGDAAHRARGVGAGLQEADVDEVVAAHQALEPEHVGAEELWLDRRDAAPGARPGRGALDCAGERQIGVELAQPALDARRRVGVQDPALADDALGLLALRGALAIAGLRGPDPAREIVRGTACLIEHDALRRPYAGPHAERNLSAQEAFPKP